jgi:hypothetical protein
MIGDNKVLSPQVINNILSIALIPLNNRFDVHLRFALLTSAGHVPGVNNVCTIYFYNISLTNQVH